ncbi:hypothetical protein DUI87_18875 [Hirundo rustica rustica]|uniref:polynucleotide adenylyltransferase n=1 Tax=Hirundo rustica rustica TaxID=333673 RepID=A0A3M0JTR3_HIRRU|nr:hypothetical protein DUI87_18875 [Hirundo rustica rustica]
MAYGNVSPVSRSDALTSFQGRKQNPETLWETTDISARVFDSIMDICCNVDFDLNVNNVIGIRNTFLLRTYAFRWIVIVEKPSKRYKMPSEVENRVRPLVLVVKKWASFHEINDASRGTLNSYSLVLMVLHYLQTDKVMFAEEASEKTLLEDNPRFLIYVGHGMSLLLLDCTSCYSSRILNWSHQMISVREAKAIERPDGVEWRNKFICVEEPFDRTNTARAVHEKQKFDMIRGEFSQAWRLLRDKKDLNCVLPLKGAILKR